MTSQAKQPKASRQLPPGGFRTRSQRPELHPLEKGVLALVTLHLCFLPWALGTMHLWSQCVSLGLAVVGFGVAVQPRSHAAAPDGGEPVVVRPLRRLWRFPCFWAGLVILLYVAIQGLNPAWLYRSNASYWWLEARPHLAWLPSGMDVPFTQAGPWRTLLILTSLWLTLCTVWIGFLRRLSVRLLFTFLVVNGVLLALLGMAQQLTHATGIFWLVPVKVSTFIASFIYRNHAGAYLNLIVALCAGLAWWYSAQAGRRMEKSSPAGVFILAGIVVGLMAVFTFSRGAALVLIAFVLVAGVVFFWCHFRQPAHERNNAVTAVMLLLLAAFVGTGLYSLGVENVWRRFGSMMNTADISLEHRREARAAAADMVQAEPAFGWGAGCFRFGFPAYAYRHPTIYYQGTENRYFWEHAHNDLLEFPIEYGAVGSALLALPLGWLGVGLLRRRGWRNPLALLLVLGCGFTVVHSWMDFVFQNPAILITWATLLLAALRWVELDSPAGGEAR